jgi:hypothetical protein
MKSLPEARLSKHLDKNKNAQDKPGHLILISEEKL